MTDANDWGRSLQDRTLGDPNIRVECEGNHYITVLEFHCQHILYIDIYIYQLKVEFILVSHIYFHANFSTVFYNREPFTTSQRYALLMCCYIKYQLY